MKYTVIAFYYLGTIENPDLEVRRHKEFFKDRDIKGRIYISSEGINAQMSASLQAAKEYKEWLTSDERFRDIWFKEQPNEEHAFYKMIVKTREQLVAIDRKVDFSKRGEDVDPAEWKKMLETMDEDTVLIDVRNDYESDVGHFEGAFCPQLSSFREFPQLAEDLKKERDPHKTKVMMYCTGGIRCEYYSVVMKEAGFDEVYQLKGGVINYAEKEGSNHWQGKLFVFDDRLVVPMDRDEENRISCCSYCEKECDIYYNCANMDCNHLFICCPECAKAHQGCCCDDCQKGRVRSFDSNENPKPFRKLPFEEKQRLSS